MLRASLGPKRKCATSKAGDWSPAKTLFSLRAASSIKAYSLIRRDLGEGRAMMQDEFFARLDRPDQGLSFQHSDRSRAFYSFVTTCVPSKSASTIPSHHENDEHNSIGMIMGEVIRFVSKSERERVRLIREARAIYDSVFPPAAPASEQRDEARET
jgi:hypothetical protein